VKIQARKRRQGEELQLDTGWMTLLEPDLFGKLCPTLRRFAMAELGFGPTAPTVPVVDCGPSASKSGSQRSANSSRAKARRSLVVLDEAALRLAQRPAVATRPAQERTHCPENRRDQRVVELRRSPARA